MTAYEIISIFLGILTLLATFGSLIVAFLAFLTRDKDNKKNKNAYPVVQTGQAVSIRTFNLLWEHPLWSGNCPHERHLLPADVFLFCCLKGSSLICITIIVLTNRYGHPHQDTLDRLKSVGTGIYRTDECGAVMFQLLFRQDLHSFSRMDLK